MSHHRESNEIGELSREAIHFNLSLFKEGLSLTAKALAELTNRVAPRAKCVEPALLSEIKGLSQGAGVPYTHFLLFNLAQDLIGAEGCTVVIARQGATQNGRPLLMKNSDRIGSEKFVGPHHWQNKQINVVQALTTGEGRKILGLSSAGLVGIKLGINSYGLTVSCNIARGLDFAQRPSDTLRLRDRITFVRQILENCTSAKEGAQYAFTHLSQKAMTTPGTIELLDERDLYIIEASYHTIAVEEITSSLSVRTNQFKILEKLVDPADESSRLRYERAREMAMDNQGHLTPNDMRQLAQDHVNGPGQNSICRHGSSYLDETTLSSGVIEIAPHEPEMSKVWFCLGKPCLLLPGKKAFLNLTLAEMDKIPEVFLNGQVWKDNWFDEPRMV